MIAKTEVEDVQVNVAAPYQATTATYDNHGNVESVNMGAGNDYQHNDNAVQTLEDESGDENAAQEAIEALEKAKQALFDNGGYPLLVFLASVILMVAASTNCSRISYCGGLNGYAVAGAVISLVVSFAYLFLEKKESLEPKTRMIMSVFLFLWWVFIAGFVTFSGPFTTPSNGYFAAWGGLIGSLMMLMNQVSKVRENIDRFSAVGHRIGILLVGSLVVLFAGVGSCHGGCSSGSAWAISAGAISFVVALVVVFMGTKISAQIMQYITLFLVVWWLVAFCTLTFGGPFSEVNNGYFGTWACLIASILINK